MTALVLVASLGLLQPAAAPARILFIGNSLTAANDLPGMVCTLARAAGRQATCQSVARPDFSLEDHWHAKEARARIAEGWDVVILQQGPSSRPESRVLLVEYAKRFDELVRASGGRTALYMVWPSRGRRADAGGVSLSYTAAARAVAGVLAPAGDAWRAAWAVDARLPLYGPDGFHPSPMGSYLASLVIYRQVFGQPPPATPVLGGAIEHAALLQRVTEETVARLAR